MTLLNGQVTANDLGLSSAQVFVYESGLEEATLTLVCHIPKTLAIYQS